MRPTMAASLCGPQVTRGQATFAQHERRLIGQRTKDALAVKREQGVTLGRPRTLPEAGVARIGAERAAGASLAAIAARLNDEGVPTAQGGAKWWPATVKAVLDSRVGVRHSARFRTRTDRPILRGTIRPGKARAVASPPPAAREGPQPVRTLYDVLAVAPDATPEEIKRTYLLRVQLLHPDRHAGASPEVLAESVRATAEVNDAWAVLRDPAARAAYDATIDGRHSSVGGEPPPDDPTPPPGPTDLSADPEPTDTGAADVDGDPIVRRFDAAKAGLIAIVVAVLALGVWIFRPEPGAPASEVSASTVSTATTANTPVASGTYPGWSVTGADRMLSEAMHNVDPAWSTCATRLFLGRYSESDTYTMTADQIRTDLDWIGQSCPRSGV